MVTASPELSPVHLPSEVTEKPLSKKNIEEICEVLKQINGLTSSRLSRHVHMILDFR